MLMDEAHVGRNSETRTYWVPHRIRPLVSAQVMREYVYVFAGVIPENGQLDAFG